MPKTTQKTKTQSKQATEEVAETPTAPDADKLKADLDALLDEIDAVLDMTTAEETVRSYIQMGGE